MHCSVLNLLIYKTLLCKPFHASKKLTAEFNAAKVTKVTKVTNAAKATKFFFCQPLCKEKILFSSRRLNSGRGNYFTKRKFAKNTRTRNMYTLAEDSHKSLIDSLKDRGIIDDDDVYETMLQVDRGKYIQEKPYVDTPVYISHGVTISSPHMHALSLKRLMDVLKPGSRAIDVGSGSGYITVCMAIRTKVLENKDSFVIGLERVKDVANFSIENIKRDKPELLHLDNFKIIHKNIYQVSEQEKEELGLFDAIHVGASASELPQILVDLLAENGKLIIPLDEGYTQVLYEITKHNGQIIKDRLFDVCFVTLKKN